MRTRLALGGGLGAVLTSILWSGSALAGTFTPEGVFQFDPGAKITLSFDTGVGDAGVSIVRGGDALEGGTFARIETSDQAFQAPLAIGTENASYRARIFARSGRIVADIVVQYPDEAAGPSFTSRLFPTGVVTSDGWYELTTSVLSIEGARNPNVSFSVYASSADMDAFELVPEGAFRAPHTCAGVVDSACVAGEYCAAGWCRNGEANVPPLPDSEYRASIAAYLGGRIQNFFGGRYTRANTMPTALATIAQMGNATNGWDYWNGFITAVHQLHDWHTTTAGPGVPEATAAFPICVVEGDADLTHDKAPKDSVYADVLVSHVGPTSNLGLKPGDRIVAVNGMHPFAFAESLDAVDWGAWRSDDPAGHAEAAERLRFLVRRWAKDITVIKCDPTTHTCGSPETIAISTFEKDTNDTVYPNCDHRPGYHLAGKNPDPVRHNSSGPFHGLLADSGDGEALYGMIWNDLYLQPGTTNRYAESVEEFRANAKGVILDHRTGNGGTEPAAEYMTTLFRAPQTLGAASGFNGTAGLFDAPFTTNDGLALYSEHKTGGDAYNIGSSTARTDLPVALLLARDGSASDWYPFGMKGGDNVRLFGRRSAGAFSSFFQFDYYGQLTWQLASGDLIRTDGTTHLGEGVVPDEEVLPKQSDLLAGKDTAYERALAWIRAKIGGSL